MSILKRSIAIGLFGLGGLFAAVSVDALLDPQEEDRVLSVLVGSVMAAVPAAGGIWLWRSANAPRLKAQAAEAQRLQSVFYQLVEEKQGKFTLIEFAIAAQLPGDKARAFLDEQSKSFGADYDVTDKGDIVYQFLLG
ncbi:MAG: hypothetical protein AAF152_04580 [Cyanobacteria bacterium P01_A01_bin.114]